MRVVIAGGHGKIALLLEQLLAERGDQAVGLIRNPAHAADVRTAGAEAIPCDLEAATAEEVTGLVAGLTRWCSPLARPGQRRRRARTLWTGRPRY